MVLWLQDFISRVNDIDNMLEDLESQYEILKTDGYVTASDGLKAQVITMLCALVVLLQDPSVLCDGHLVVDLAE